MKRFKLFNGTKLDQTRRKIITTNANGGGLDDAYQSLGFSKVDCLVYDFYKHPKHGWVSSGNYSESLVFEKDGRFFERVGFEHFNGHFSNFKEGVYEVSFRELKQI